LFFRGIGQACSEKWFKKIAFEELSQASNTANQTQKCLPRCESQTETPTFTFSAFPIKSTFFQHQYFCIALEKLARICSDRNRAKIFESAYHQYNITCNDILNSNNTKELCTSHMEPTNTILQDNNKLANFLLKYSRENLAMLRVLFKDPFYMLIKRDEQMSVISFLGNTGGLLGLCMGMSLVSIFEIVYHLLCFFNDMILKMVGSKTFN
jgi:hypothetical protein